MAASNWLRDGAEATRRRQRTLLAVAASATLIPAVILILATVVARADVSTRPLAAETTVAGTVINASSGVPVAGATVFASRDSAGYAAVKTTGASGSFSFTDVPLAPDVIVRAEAAGFATSFLNGGILLDTTSGADVAGLSLAMHSGASVSGTVTRASDDTGVNEVVISARSLAGPVFTILSASDGAYSFAALPPGDYIFHAATTSSENLAGRFSGGASTRARASTITLTDGASLSAVDFSLQAAGGVSGFVTDLSDDSAVSGVRVTARRVDDRSAEITAVSDPAGAYRISSLSPGNYIVRAVPPASTAFSTQIYDGALDQSDAIVVEVEAGEDTEGVDFALESGVDVSGTVRSASSGLGVSGAVVTASDFTTGETIAVAIADSTGSYVLPGVPAGSYRLHARPPPARTLQHLPRLPRLLEGAFNRTRRPWCYRSHINAFFVEGRLFSACWKTGIVSPSMVAPG